MSGDRRSARRAGGAKRASRSPGRATGVRRRSRLAPRDRVPLACLATFLAVWGLLAISPRYRADWWLENLPVFIGVPIGVVASRRWR